MKTGLLVLLAVALVILLLVFLFGFDRGHMWGHEGRMDFGHGSGYMWILFLIIIGIAVYLVIESQRSKTESDKETPLEISKKRFARGEITKEEFEEIDRKLEE